MRKIAVIGSGAVGCFYGGMLAAAGAEVHFLMRSDLAAVRANGVTIHTGGRTVRIESVLAHESTEVVETLHREVEAMVGLVEPFVRLVEPFVGRYQGRHTGVHKTEEIRPFRQKTVRTWSGNSPNF